MSESPEAASGGKPIPIRIAAVTATGVPNPAAPSKNAPDREGDEQKLQAAVPGDPGQAGLEGGEMAFLLGQRIEEDDVEDDPADGEQPVGGPVRGHGRRLPGRHAEDGDGDEEGGPEPEKGGEVGPELEEGERAEQDDDRKRRGQRREEPMTGRVVDLVPGHRIRGALYIDPARESMIEKTINAGPP